MPRFLNVCRNVALSKRARANGIHVERGVTQRHVITPFQLQQSLATKGIVISEQECKEFIESNPLGSAKATAKMYLSKIKEQQK